MKKIILIFILIIMSQSLFAKTNIIKDYHIEMIVKDTGDIHIKENLEALKWKIKKEDVKEIDSIKTHRRYVNAAVSEFDY